MKPTSLGLKFLSALTAPGDLIQVGPELFQEGAEALAFEYMKSHLKQFGVIPDHNTVLTHSHVELPEVKEPAKYFLHHMKARRTEEVLRSTIESVKPFFSKHDPQPFEALALFDEMTTELRKVNAGAEIVDHRFSTDAVLDHYAAVHKTGGMLGIPLGWEYIDEMMGGAQPGDLLSLVARPGKGKTFALCYSALHAWACGKRPMFVTIEMPAIQIQQRLAAVGAHVPAMELKLGKLTTPSMEKLKATMAGNELAKTPFWIIDGTKGISIDDLLTLARQLQPDIIYVDGAYMLRHPNKLLTKFRRVDEVAEFLKLDLAGGYGAPTFATWQFNREAAKKKKDVPVGLEDIAHSDVIGQISNLVMGLFEDDDPSNAQTKLVTVLKGRSGEEGEFKIGWDFLSMDFSQKFPSTEVIPEPETDDELLDG